MPPLATKMLEKKPPTFLIYVLAIVFVFASIDTYRATEFTVLLNSVFILPVRAYLFSAFEVLILLLSYRLLTIYDIQYKEATRLPKAFFWVAAGCVVLNLANPNNQYKAFFGIPFVLIPGDFAFICFLFCVLFVDKKGFLDFKETFIRVTIYLVCIRSLILFALWSVGEGNHEWYGQNITLGEGDTLMVLAFCQTLLLALFLARREVLPLAGWFLLFAVLAFSFRRSALAVAVASNVMVFFYYALSISKMKRVIGVTVTISLLILCLFVIASSFLPSDVYSSYVERYTGPIVGTAYEGFGSDSGHFLESIATLVSAVDRGSFWGYGNIDLSQVSIEGATLGYVVHNVYAATWLYEGIYNLLFYGLMLYALCLHLFKALVGRERELDIEQRMVRFSVIVFMLSVMLMWIFSPITMAESSKMRFLWMLTLSFILRGNDSQSEAIGHGIVEAN